VEGLSNQPISIVADPNNAARVWIARTGQGVFYSDNEGVSWEQRINGLTNPNVITLEMAPDDPDVIFAGCRPGGSSNVFKTTNGGATGWSALGEITGQEVHDIETPGAGSNVLLAACGGGIYKSVDGGQNWELKQSGEAQDIARDPNPSHPSWFFAVTKTKVWKSTNDGLTWTELPPLPAGADLRKVAVSPSTRVYVAAAPPSQRRGEYWCGVYWKDDPEPGWHSVGPDDGLYDMWATSLALDLRSSNILLYGTATCLYRSTDYGASWTSSVSGMRQTYPSAFNPCLPGALFAKGVLINANPVGGDASHGVVVYRSTNSSGGWDNIYSHSCYGTTKEYPVDSPRGARTMVVHPQDASRVYLTYESSGLDDHWNASTSDGGRTWWDHHYNSACMEQAIAVDSYQEAAYVAGDNPEFMVTINGGRDWNGLDVSPGGALSVASFPKDMGQVFLGTGLYGVYRSSNFGQNWEQVGLQGKSVVGLAIDNLNRAIIYAGSQGVASPGVHKSTNDGGSWTPMSSGLDYPSVTSLASDPAEPAIVYAATRSGGPPQRWEGHCFVTVDGAAQWSELPQIPNTRYIYDLQIDYHQPDKLYAVSFEYDPNPGGVGFIPTGVYSLTPTYQFKPLTSANSNASDYNSQRKLIRQEGTTNLHAVYHSGSASTHNIYYTSSSDGGSTWSPKVLLGQGKDPTLALDDVGNPQVIWLSDNGNQLLYAYRQGGVWSASQTIYSVGAAQKIGPPAFCVVTSLAGCRGHVVFDWWNGLNPPRASYAVKYGWLSLNASGTLQNVGNIENAGSAVCSRPSIAVYNGNFMGQSGYSLHVAWTKGNYVYYSAKRLDSGPWSSPVTKVSTAVGSHDPSVEAYGDRVHVAWVEPATATKVMHRSRFLPDGMWDFAETVTQSSYECASPQMVSGSYCFWSQKDNGVNWEIYYSWWSPSGWNTPINLSSTPQRSFGSHAALMPTPMGSQIYCFWTEDDAAPYQEYFAQTAGPLGGFFTLDAGREQASPYTVHRGGYLQYDSLMEKTVDTSGTYLSYRFEHLDPRRLYLVRASYYQETGSPAVLEVKVDGSVFANVAVPNRSVIRGEAWVPSELYADSVVEFVIRKKSGTLGTLGYLELCQAEPKGKGGPQSSGLADLSLPKEFSLGPGYPNPMSSEARIEYALPKASSVDLTVYNISGQVVRRLLSEPSKSPGRYSVRWDGRNGLSQRVPAGVYFYRLNAGSFSETRKLVVIR